MVALVLLVRFPLIVLSFIALSQAFPLKIVSRGHIRRSNHACAVLAPTLNSSTMTPISSFSTTETATSQAPTGTSSPVSLEYVLAPTINSSTTIPISSVSATETATSQAPSGTSAPTLNPSTTMSISSVSATETTTSQAPTGTSSPSVSSKYIIAHFMVGNVYSYTVDNWLADIFLAHSSGIDGF